MDGVIAARFAKLRFIFKHGKSPFYSVGKEQGETSAG